MQWTPSPSLSIYAWPALSGKFMCGLIRAAIGDVVLILQVAWRISYHLRRPKAVAAARFRWAPVKRSWTEGAASMMMTGAPTCRAPIGG